MKRKNLLSIVCIIMSLVMLAGCASKPEPSGNTDTPSEEAAKIVMPLLYLAEEPKDLKLVQDAINDISVKEINVEVELLPISLFQYGDQLNLMISGGEQLDIAPVFPSLSMLVSKGQIMPLDDLLSEYGQGILEAVGDDYMQGPVMDGSTYAIPILHEMATAYGITYSVEMAEKFGVDMSQVKTLDDLDAVLASVYEQDPSIYAIAAKSTGMTLVDQAATWDLLGDGMGVLLDPASDTTVVNLYESDIYKELVEHVRKWYLDGYIMKDQATTTESLLSLISAGKAFCGLTNYKPGVDMEQTLSCGTEIAVIPLSTPIATNTSTSSSGMCIPITAKDPAAAMKFLNLMYTNADIINLLDWGIEGSHYVITADGTIDYPEGVTAESSGYNIGTTFMYGNEMLRYIWNGGSPDLWTETAAFNDEAIPSIAIGFNFDSSTVKTQVTAVTNVINQYAPALGNGALDPETALPEFIEALKTAGIDDIIAEKQTQLDAYLESIH